MVKKFLKNILESGWLSFPLGYVKLSTLNRLEIKKTKFINTLLLGYYKQKVKNIKINCNENGQNKRIFIMMNILPLWEKSTSNFFKWHADLIEFYSKHNIELHLILTNHSHVSYLSNNGIKWKNFMQVKSDLIEKKIYEDLYNMTGIKNRNVLKIHILNDNNGEIILNKYIVKVVSFFLKLNLSSNDLVINQCGKIKSTLLEIMMEKICSKKLYIPGGFYDKPLFEEFYTYISTPNLAMVDNVKYVRTPNINLNPFFWETLETAKLSKGEEDFLIRLNEDESKYLFVSAKQKIASSIDDEFIEIMNEIANKYSSIHFCLIGDTRQAIEEKLKNKITFDFKQISVVEFSESLYSFYSKMNSEKETFFIFPRISGGGTGILACANAKIPTTIFKGNDAEGSLIPLKYFVNTKDDFLNQIDKFVKNENNERDEFLRDFTEHKEKTENESKEMCMRLLYADK